MADISMRFLEVEQRVRDLVTDNKRLRNRVLELETELTTMQSDLQELRKYRGQRTQLRERLERILQQLESLKAEEQPADDSARQG